METPKNYLESHEFNALTDQEKFAYYYWIDEDRYYRRYVPEYVLNTFPAKLRELYTVREYNTAWNCAPAPQSLPLSVKPNVTALAVDQAPDKRYQDLGVSYGDLARNFRNFHNVLRYLTNCCDRPSDEEIIEIQSALFDIKHILGLIVAERITDKEKQPELALPTAKVGNKLMKR